MTVPGLISGDTPCGYAIDFGGIMLRKGDGICDILRGFGRPPPASVAGIDHLPNVVLR